MTKEEIQAKFSRLPEAVQDHLYSEIIGELNGIIIDGNDLTDAQRPTLFALIKELIVGAVPLASVVAEVQTSFGLDAAKSQKLALDILGYRLLPLDGFVGDVTSQVKTLGGDPMSYPTDRVVLVKEPAPVVTVAMALDARLKERYHSIAESFFRGVRTEAQTLELLQKSFKTGGLELSEATAKQALIEISAEAEVLKSQEAAAATLAKDAGPVEPSTDESVQTPTPKPRIDAPTIEDEADVANFKEGVLDSQEAEKANLTDEKIKAAIDEIYAASGVFPADLDLQVRLKSAIEGRLRDIRDSLETLETLVQPKELGGVALSQDDARQVLKLVDAKLRNIHESHRQEVESTKKAWLETEARKKVVSEEADQTKEAVKLDSLYQAIISKSTKALAKSSDKLGAAAAAVTTASISTAPVTNQAGARAGGVVGGWPGSGAPEAGADVGEHLRGESRDRTRQDDSTIGPIKVVPPSPTPALVPMNLPIIPTAVLSRPPLPNQSAPALIPVPRPAFLAVPAPTAPVSPPAVKPPVVITPKSMPVIRTLAPTLAPQVMPRISAAPSVRPMIQDVKAQPSVRLTGPVAELRDTALIDFRRLSKDPIEACLKIKDKIDLLLHESYEKRTEGIRAWNDSEVYRTYLGLMRDALEGRPLPQVIAEHQAKAEPTLTIEEVRAIAELSQKLRY